MAASRRECARPEVAYRVHNCGLPSCRVFARSHERKSTTTVYDWRHYLAVVQRKPGALRNGAPFAELPPAFRALQQRMLKTPGGDREMVEILALVLQHDEQAVLTAVELALEAGARRRPIS